MSIEEIKEKLIALCCEIFKNSGFDIDLIEYADFIDDLGMDSITFITLIVEIEGCFDIVIPDDLLLMDNFKNVNDVIQVVSNQLTEITMKKEDECNDEA